MKIQIRKANRILIIVSIYLFNLAAFQNCSKYQSGYNVSSSRTVLGGDDGSGGSGGGSGGGSASNLFNSSFTCKTDEIITKTMFTASRGKQIWSDGQSFASNRPLPYDENLTITDMPYIRYTIDSWKAVGGTSVSFQFGWQYIHLAPNRFALQALLYTLNYAKSQNMKVVFRFTADAIGGWQQAADWRIPISEHAKTADGQTTRSKNMSFSSSKWATNFGHYVNSVSDKLKQSPNSDALYYVVLNTTIDDEIGYDHYAWDSYDFSSMANSAWVDFLRKKYTDNTPYGRADQVKQPANIGSDGIGLDQFLFRTQELNKAIKIFGEAFRKNSFKVVLDAGSFTDTLETRNVWALPAGSSILPVDGYKQNPAFSYSPELNAKTLSCTGKWSSNEWTWDQEPGAENLNVNSFVARVKRSIDAGVTDISFSFLSPQIAPNAVGTDEEKFLGAVDYQYYIPHPELANIMNKLRSDGYLDKKQQCIDNSGVQWIDLSMREILQQKNFNNVTNQINQSVQNNGVRKTCVRYNNDIGVAF